MSASIERDLAINIVAAWANEAGDVITDKDLTDLTRRIETGLLGSRRRVEVKATEDGLWIHLHGDTVEGAVNLTESVTGPITCLAIAEVWSAFRAQTQT